MILYYFLILILIIGGITALVIVIKNNLAKNKTNQLIHKARSGKLDLTKLREQLIYRMGLPFTSKKAIPINDEITMSSLLKQIQVMGTRVIDVQLISETELLIISETSYEDQVSVSFGVTSNLERKFATSYILRHFPEKNEFALYSDLYENDDTLRARERFKQKMIEQIFL